jgi:hypothetical protein
LSRAARKAGTAGSEGTPARQRAGVTRRDLLLDRPEKVISPNDFASTGQLAATLLAFTARYNQTTRPFNWKYTATDLATTLDRISAHQQPAKPPASLPKAA